MAYCPAAVREPTLALLALDARCAALIRNSTEPMLAQLRLSWWRETLTGDVSAWPQGDPLIDLLRSWEGQRASLVALVDGWEGMTQSPPLQEEAIIGLGRARGEAFAALSCLIGNGRDANAALRSATGWALADIASRLTHPDEKRVARDLLARHDWETCRLPRSLRPLAVLHGLARRSARRGTDLGEDGVSALLAVMRLGLLGR